MNRSVQQHIFVCFSLLCLLIVYPGFTFGEHKSDSLKEVLIGYTNLDANYIRLLCDLSFESWEQDPDESKKYGIKALEVADSLNDNQGIALANLAIGLSSWGQENFDQAMRYFLDAEQIIKDHGDSNDIMLIKFHIAQAYRTEGIIDLSNKNYKILIPYYTGINNSEMLAKTYEGYGKGSLHDKKYETALILLDSAQTIYKKLKDRLGIISCDLNKGIANLKLENFDKAHELIKNSLNGYLDIDDERGIVIARKEIGSAYLSVDKVDSASTYLNKALNDALKYEMGNEVWEIYLTLYELEFSRKNFEKALEYYKLHVAAFDKRVNRQISFQVHEMKMKYDKEKNEQEIILLSQQKEIQNIYIISLSLLIIVISISAVFIMLSLRNNRKKDSLLNESKQALMLAEISNSKLKEKELKIELEKKDMELTSYTMNFIKKNELLSELQDKLNSLDVGGNEQLASKLRELNALLKRHINSEKDWDEFKSYFDNAHPSFIQALRTRNPDLSSADIRLSSLLKLNLNSKQIADVMGISPDSVKTARYRLRNKFGLDREQNLLQFLNRLEAEELVKGT